MCTLLIVFFIMAPTISTNVQAEVKELGKGFPDTEVFTPGEWFYTKTC